MPERNAAGHAGPALREKYGLPRSYGSRNDPSSAPVCALGHLPPQGEGFGAGTEPRPYKAERNVDAAGVVVSGRSK